VNSRDDAAVLPIDEQVRWTVAAFMSNRDGTYGDVIAVVRAAGIPQPSHACAMLVLAYGRHILDTRGAHTSPMYTEHRSDGTTVERKLIDDPFFAAAREIVRDGAREEFELIGLIGGEVRAVMAEMSKGVLPDELLLPPSRVDVDPTDANPPAVELPDLTASIAAMVRRRGSSLELEVSVIPYQLTPTQALFTLDVHTRSGGRRVRDSIACGDRSLAGAYASALEQFELGTLPVLLAAFAGNAQHGVERHDLGTLVVWAGVSVQMWGTDVATNTREYFDKLLCMLAAAPLTREVHWGRTWAQVDGSGALIASEMLLDDERWALGDDLARTHPWVPGGSLGSSVRHFFVMLPK